MPTISSQAPAETAISYALEIAKDACSRIAPLWPIKRFVAVNPFLGHSKQSFLETCDLIRRVVPGGMQMPTAYYLSKYRSGTIRDADLGVALVQARRLVAGSKWQSLAASLAPQNLKSHIIAAERDAVSCEILTVAEAVDQTHRTSWARIVVDSISTFCAGYFDDGQSAWPMPWKTLPMFFAWKQAFSLDASIEMQGLRNFRNWISKLPDEPEVVIALAMERLQLTTYEAEDFFHKTLMSIRGWSSYVQFHAREALGESGSDALLHLLAIRLCYDMALHERYDSVDFREFWTARPDWETAQKGILAKFVWQLADEHVCQRELFAKLRARKPVSTSSQKQRPSAHAVFCIDVRSEVMRRHLESVAPDVHTTGFAGFFGIAMEYTPFGHNRARPQCPVLLSPKYRIKEAPRDTREGADRKLLDLRIRKRLNHSWNSFKTSAISCFSFVETAGLGFGLKLFQNTFTMPEQDDAPLASFAPEINSQTPDFGIPVPEQIEIATGMLKNMGLTRDFARVILLCGHGSATSNNPYMSSLDCGACGGHAGHANARVGVAILNSLEVRAGLSDRGISIPDDTLFIAGMHNTTTDHISLFDLENVPQAHKEDVNTLHNQLLEAGRLARRERSAKMALKETDKYIDIKITHGSRDWSQVRPEWGLAGNAAFIAAPRSRTKGIDLGGRVFLHDYHYAEDTDLSILTLIMTAPMVVANWINLQYYGSTVNNAVFGSGNKVTHNVVGILGVCQGNGGDLQTGLPFQSIHNGKDWMHHPLRLHVIIEAPCEALESVITKHENIRDLIENGWLLLFAIDPEDTSLYSYQPGMRWEHLGSIDAKESEK